MLVRPKPDLSFSDKAEPSLDRNAKGMRTMEGRLSHSFASLDRRASVKGLRDQTGIPATQIVYRPQVYVKANIGEPHKGRGCESNWAIRAQRVH